MNSGRAAKTSPNMSSQVVILAGGKGRRLLPYTTSFPKPLMPLGERPILEIILRQLARDGYFEITLAVGHLASLIEAYFGDGSSCGVRLSYLREETPLGTAGPLAKLPGPPDNLLVLNGDILTDLDFSTIVSTHLNKRAAATIMTIVQKIPIDYGVLTTNNDGHVLSYDEKPQLTTEVSGGIYVFSRRALKYIPVGERFDFPDLVKLLLDRGETVATHRHEGHWLDIGRRDDYQMAADLFKRNQELFLPPIPQGTPLSAANLAPTAKGHENN
jgi:NDP-sugar pyrophosphorylase family protein